MNGFLNVSSSPHVRSGETTTTIMLDVAIALLPATAFGVFRFGIYSLLVILISIASSVAAEAVYQKITNQKITILDGSALVTGLLIALNMPPRIPLWVPVLGSIFAIIFVKQIFGGIGQNFMNPALGARCFLLISFTGMMSNFAVDGMSGATPLAALKAGESVGLLDSFLGFIPGTIGEVSAFMLLIGGFYLIFREVITWHIPVCYIAAFAVFELIFGGHGFDLYFVAAEVCSGGLILGAFFMATDYVSSPITENGKILFGVVLGILTGIFRTFGVSAEGVSYAIIFCNLLVPLIEKVTMPTAFGYEDGALEGKKGIDLSMYKPAFTLLGITVVAGLALGAVYQLTKGPIEKAEEKAARAAYVAVCPDAAEFVDSEELAAAVEACTEGGSFAGGQFGNIAFESEFAGVDGSGNNVGYVVNVTSKDGFGGEITMSVGVTADQTVTGLKFLTINETAGLGMNATKEDFWGQYVGKTTDAFNLVKSGAAADNDIQAISGATITSTAVTNAMNAVLYLVANAGL